MQNPDLECNAHIPRVESVHYTGTVHGAACLACLTGLPRNETGIASPSRDAPLYATVLLYKLSNFDNFHGDSRLGLSPCEMANWRQHAALFEGCEWLQCFDSEYKGHKAAIKCGKKWAVLLGGEQTHMHTCITIIYTIPCIYIRLHWQGASPHAQHTLGPHPHPHPHPHLRPHPQAISMGMLQFVARASATNVRTSVSVA